MPDPIKHLLAEHVEILAQFAELETAVAQLQASGEASLPQSLPVFQQVGQMMATQLDRHRRKEDEVLFPAVEAVIGEEGPTVVMRQEHREIHAQGVTFRETLHQLHELEHPQIEANGEQLRQLANNGGSAASLIATSQEILELVKMHFEKEEQILFPMANQLLDSQTLVDIATKIRLIDLEQQNLQK